MPLSDIRGQDKAKSLTRKASTRTEPLRVINGEMVGNTISGKFTPGGQRASFFYTLTKANVVDGRLRLSGSFALGSGSANPKAGNVVIATLAGTMARSANPWPSANDPPRPQRQGQQAQRRQGEQEERTEQTQSLYVGAETGGGCEVVFLSLALPPRLRARLNTGSYPLQLGVTLVQTDNRRGQEINRHICYIARALSNKSAAADVSATIDQLNRLIASSQ